MSIPFSNEARLACVASVSVWFQSKQRGARVKDRAKNGASERAGRGWEEVSFLPFPLPLPPLLFLGLSKPKMPFLGLSFLRNQTETLVTQAKARLSRQTVTFS